MRRPTVDQHLRCRQRRRNIVQGIVLLGGMVAAVAVVGWLARPSAPAFEAEMAARCQRGRSTLR